MSLSPYRPVPGWQRGLRSSAIGLSIGVHVLLALFLLSNPAAAQKASQWVEVALNEPKPPEPKPPEPEPAPEPEPEPKPKPKVVKFEDTTPTPPPPTAAAPPEPPRRVVRQVQGLTANSFAPGASTGLSVRAGNSTGVAAGKESMSLADASGPFEPRSYTAVTKAPRRQWAPNMDVPEAARKAGLNGQVVKVLLDIDPKGKVTRVQITQGLGYGVDEACVDAWRKSRWKPAEQDGVPVAVIGVPESCLVNEF